MNQPAFNMVFKKSKQGALIKGYFLFLEEEI